MAVATTAQWVFDKAMYLMDEADQTSGQADHAETREYKNRTLPILNVLRVECFPYSDTCQAHGPGRRPVCPEIPDLEAAENDYYQAKIGNFTEEEIRQYTLLARKVRENERSILQRG